MTTGVPARAIRLCSLVKSDATLELFLEEVDVPEPAPGEVVVRIEAAPINPSDLGLLFAAADMTGASASGTAERPVLTAPIPGRAMAGLAGRVGEPMPVGNEGAGTVVAAGSAPEAQGLLGKVVAVAGGAMYSQYRAVPAAACLELPEGSRAEDGASSFVNPMTVLAMVETMRLEGHTALSHTAAASNLGQMLNRVCIEDGIPLVNVVRRQDQAELLRSQGASHVCDSSEPGFLGELTEALVATSATLAFDAVGGGKLAGQLLSCMEAAAARTSDESYSRYGSSVHKQVYIYGALDRGPTELLRNFGFSWGLGGWLLTPVLQKIGPEATRRLRDRVGAGLKTTFASHYAGELSLAGVLSFEAVARYGRQATGQKYLVTPHR